MPRIFQGHCGFCSTDRAKSSVTMTHPATAPAAAGPASLIHESSHFLACSHVPSRVCQPRVGSLVGSSGVDGTLKVTHFEVTQSNLSTWNTPLQ
jgi:hypothetical protein